MSAMGPKNILDVASRKDFRLWFSENNAKETECWIAVKKGKIRPCGAVWYLDAVEEALCFGWIDTTHKTVDGTDMQKFTPRSKKSAWSELNKERCRRLEKLGLMTDMGRKVLPDMSETSFLIDKDIMKAFDQNPIAWKNFQTFPALYQRVRIDCIQRDKNKDRAAFERRVEKLIVASALGNMFGDWNDYGILLDY